MNEQQSNSNRNLIHHIININFRGTENRAKMRKMPAEKREKSSNEPNRKRNGQSRQEPLPARPKEGSRREPETRNSSTKNSILFQFSNELLVQDGYYHSESISLPLGLGQIKKMVPLMDAAVSEVEGQYSRSSAFLEDGR
jgi:hypothetical protein